MAYQARRSAYGWDPFAELQALRAELGRMINAGWTRTWGGDVDLDHTGDGWTVTARLPGVAPDEVTIDFDDRELHIRARSEAEINEQAAGVNEQAAGVNAPREGQPAGARRRAFEYRVLIPGEVDPDAIDATMDHGLLTVRLPRVTKSERRQIKIGQHPASVPGPRVSEARVPGASVTGAEQSREEA